MKRNIELTLEMQLGRLQNLRQNVRNIESKLNKLEDELRKYKESISQTEKTISEIGLSVIPEKDRNSISPEKRIQYETRNRALQEEKKDFISNNYPELIKEENNEENEFLKMLKSASMAQPRS